MTNTVLLFFNTRCVRVFRFECYVLYNWTLRVSIALVSHLTVPWRNSVFFQLLQQSCVSQVCNVMFLHRRARLGQVFEIIFNLQQFEMFSNIFVQPWGLDKRSTWHGLLKECEWKDKYALSGFVIKKFHWKKARMTTTASSNFASSQQDFIFKVLH